MAVSLNIAGRIENYATREEAVARYIQLHGTDQERYYVQEYGYPSEFVGVKNLETALHTAALFWREDIVTLLLQELQSKGMEEIRNGQSPCYSVVDSIYEKMIRQALKAPWRQTPKDQHMLSLLEKSRYILGTYCGSIRPLGPLMGGLDD